MRFRALCILPLLIGFWTGAAEAQQQPADWEQLKRMARFGNSFPSRTTPLQEAKRAHIFQVVRNEACRQGVPPPLALAITRIETDFRSLVSPKDARGPMQVLPATAQRYGADPDRLLQPEYGVQIGVRIIADLRQRFRHPATIAAAYYAGENFASIRAEAVQLDVLRYSRLVEMAMEKYKHHKCEGWE